MTETAGNQDQPISVGSGGAPAPATGRTWHQLLNDLSAAYKEVAKIHAEIDAFAAPKGYTLTYTYNHMVTKNT